MSPKLTLIVAVARNGVIGASGALPWRLSSDLQRFKAATMGKPVLMGRKTWESLPRKPLPGRANLVITRQPDFRAEGGWTFTDLSAALAAARAMAEKDNAEEICIIGGAELFAATLPLADRILYTEVDLAPAGDVHFPALDQTVWMETAREAVSAGPKDDAGFTVRTLERRR